MFLQKLKYLFRSILKITQTKRCPNCGATGMMEVDNKYLITRLYKCSSCKLNFRFPVDSKQFLIKFYQSEYQADYSEFTREITSLPTEEQLANMTANNFRGKRDYSPFVASLLKERTGKILDYGCSWGYSIYQLKKAGFDTEGFEISKARAEFGKKIGVTIHSKETDVRNNNDLIMSSHAIEHLPVISEFIKFSKDKLNHDGIFMAFCPNGADEYRKREPGVFHVNWGFLHPNYLDIEFAETTFRRNPYLIMTGDWTYDLNELALWDGQSQVTGSRRDGQELLIISKPNIYLA